MKTEQYGEQNFPLLRAKSSSSAKIKAIFRIYCPLNLTQKVDIELHLCTDQGITEHELIPGILAKTNERGEILLKSVVSSLKDKGYMLYGTMISYYSKESDAYIFCATDPMPNSVTIPMSEIMNSKLILRAKMGQISEMEEPLEIRPKVVKKPATGGNPPKRSRTKERKIGQIIDQVSTWRKYYNGFTDYHGRVVKMSLEEGASKIGIPKKSLDDYYLQLRLGRKYGFDFNKHKDDNVGVLRTFIKNERANEKKESENSIHSETE